MKFTFLFLVLLFIGTSLFAQESNHPKVTEYEIESKIFNEKRLVSVSTPVGYDEKDTETRYLVAYLFDGQFTPYFNLVNSTLQYYSQTGEGVPMIVISIHTSNRPLEFTPKAQQEKTVQAWEGQCGEADKLTQFLREEVVPQIESKYLVHPYRLGIGHSLGGTYVLTEMMKPKSLFHSVIAVSPNLVYDNEQVVEQGKNYFANTPNSQAFIYCSAGDQGEMENSFRKSLEKLDSIAQIDRPKNLTWHYSFWKGDGHMGTFIPTFDKAYRAFSKKFTLTEDQSETLAQSKNPIFEFHQHFKNKSQFAGFEMTPTNDDYNNFAYALNYFERYDIADDLIEIAIEKYPEDANLLDSRGEILENSGDNKNAHQSYLHALKILEQYKANYDPEMFNYYRETFQSNADRTAGTGK